MHSDFAYKKYDAWVAPVYGTKVQTVGLRAAVADKKSITHLIPLGP